MKFLIFFVFCSFLGLSTSSDHFKIENLESSSGLLVDFTSKLVFAATDEMQLAIYADLEQYNDQVDIVSQSYEMLNDLCKIRECILLNRTAFIYESFVNKAYTLASMLRLSQMDIPHTITGRPISIEAANEILKSIEEFDEEDKSDRSKFGLLSEAKVSKRNETFSKLERLKALYEKHTELMEATEQNEDKIKNDHEIGNSIDIHLYVLSLTCSELYNEMTWLTESLYYAENKVLHPEIMNAEQFIRKMTRASTYLPENIKFPYPVLSENAHNLMHLMEFNTFYHKRTIVFILNIPLVEDVTYNLYNLLPLPMETSEGKFVYVKPSTDNIAISEDLKQYAPMDILRYCTKLEYQMMMCKPVQVYSVEHKPICETELIVGKKKIPDSCNTKIVANNLDIWHKLQSGNEWLYVKSQPEDVTIQCDEKEKLQVKISKTGVLTLDSECIASTDSVKVGPGGSMKNTSSVVSTSGDIAKDVCCNDEAATETFRNEDVFTQKLSNINLHNVDSISYKIKSSQNNKVDIRLISEWMCYKNQI